jgi:hypothetical protein
MHADTADAVAADLALAGVQPGTHLAAERLHRVANCHGAPNRSLRAVESREEPVAGCVDLTHLDDQIDQALCLTLVTNACVLWTTTYLGDTIDALRADDIEITDEIAAHLTPTQHDHINFYDRNIVRLQYAPLPRRRAKKLR